MTTPFSPVRVGRLTPTPEELLLEAADPGYTGPPAELEGLSAEEQEELLLESIPTEIEPQVGPDNLLKMGLVYDIPSGGWVSPEDATPDPDLQQLQRLMNNDYQSIQLEKEGDPEDGYLDNPVPVSGFYDQETKEWFERYRKDSMGRSAEDAAFDLDSGTLFGPTQEEAQATIDAIVSRGGRPPRPVGGEWLVSPIALERALDEVADAIVQDMVEEDPSRTREDIRPGVVESLEVYRVHGAGNWTRVWLEALEAGEEATELQGMIGAIGPQLIRLDVSPVKQDEARYSSTEERLKEQIRLEGADTFEGIIDVDDIKTEVPLAPTDYIKQDVYRFEGTMFRFPEASKAEAAETIMEWSRDPDRAAERYARKLQEGLYWRRALVMENRWTDDPRNTRGETFNVYLHPELFDMSTRHQAVGTIDRSESMAAYGGFSGSIASRSSEIVSDGIDKMRGSRGYVRSGPSGTEGVGKMGAADRLLVRLSTTDPIGKNYPLLYDAWEAKRVEAAERGLNPGLDYDELGPVMDRGVSGAKVFDRFERALETGSDPFADADLALAMLNLLDAYADQGTYGQLLRYRTILERDALYEGMPLIDSDAEGAPRINPNLSEETRNMYIRMYRPLSKLYTDELGKGIEGLKQRFYADLSYAVDMLEKPSRGYGDEAATWISEKAKQSGLARVELMYGGSELVTTLWGDYLGISPERQQQMQAAAAKARARSQFKLEQGARRERLMSIVDPEPISELTAVRRAGVQDEPGRTLAYTSLGLLSGKGGAHLPKGIADLVQVMHGRTGLDDLQLNIAKSAAEAAGDEEGMAAIEAELTRLRSARTQLPIFDMMGGAILEAESIDDVITGLGVISYNQLPKHVKAEA